jgi:hypothetical protein
MSALAFSAGGVVAAGFMGTASFIESLFQDPRVLMGCVVFVIVWLAFGGMGRRPGWRIR